MGVISKHTDKTSLFCRAAGWILNPAHHATCGNPTETNFDNCLIHTFPYPHRSVISKAYSIPRSIKLPFSICRGRQMLPQGHTGSVWLKQGWTLEVHVLSQHTIHQNILPNQLLCSIISISCLYTGKWVIIWHWKKWKFALLNEPDNLYYACFYHTLNSCVIRYFYTPRSHKLDWNVIVEHVYHFNCPILLLN